MRSSLATLGWFVVLFLALPSASARERDGPEPRSALRYERHAPPASDLFLTPPRPLRVTAAASTTFLGAWDFESTLGCDAQGWTSHDITEQATYFHVADASELDGGTYGRLLPLRGAQSLWCGLPADSLAFPQCGWVEAPGYGNGWKQVWATKECIDVDLGAQITFVFSCDSEPNYDATYVEVSECGADTWVLVDGGKLVFDGVITDETHTTQITGFDSTSIEIRFRFNSDGAWSDEDGFWVGDGAILIDSLFVTDATGIRIPVEDFEDEAPGSQETEHWHVSTQAPFGDYAGLFWGGDVLQEDACGSNLSCFWGFFEGSTYDYSCGGHPGQPVVPYLNCYGWNEAVGLTNEVWSPWIAWAGTGDVAWLAFDVYRDLALDDFVFYTWRVRSIVDGCITRWQSDGWGYGDSKDWYRHRTDVGHLVDPNASHVQIALGAIDALDPIYCNLGWWPCHSQAPLIDNVLFYRQANFGPKWTVRAIDLFQDTFPRDGSLTGTGRADMAQDPAHGYHEPEYFPGDSAVVYSVTDYNGLALVGGPPYDHRAVYCYVSVAPPDPNKAGVNLENSNLLGGLPRFAYRGMVNAAGMDWTQLNCDRRRNSAGVALSDARFCIDLPDNLFEAGDTIHYFFGAHNTLNEWSYWTREAGAAYAIEEAAALPLEFQILPGAGAARGGDILYVDGMDGLGAQPYFDTAFQQLADYGKYVDRFDVNGPSSGVSNRLGTRVYDIAQLTTPYRAIVWNTGDLPITIGDGTGNPEKSNDWLVLDAFLQGLWDAEQTGGLYLNGDDLPSVWAGQVGASAVAMRDWLHYSLPAGGDNHLPLVGVSPYGVGLRVADNAFGDPVGRHALGVDTLVAFGGCPAINDFDFVTPTGAATVQMEYRGVGDLGPGTANAIIGERHPSLGGTVSVLMSGFSFHYIRDDRLTAELDRAHHLRDVLRWFATGPLGPPTGAGDGPRYTNSLAQNYPNPFNPTTTITFTVKARTRVRLRIYDVTGALVKKLVDDVRAPGITHEVRWDGRNEVGKSVASGVYFYRLVAKDFVQTRKMVVLK